MVDLVTKDQEGSVGQRFHGQQRIELSLGLSKALVVLGVDKEHNAADFREVVAP